MPEKTKQYVCSMYLRPRVNGSCILIEPGTPFDGNVLDDHTREAYIRVGTLKEYHEAIDVEATVIDIPVITPVKEPVFKEAPKAKGKKSKKDAPKGVFCLKAEDLVDKELSELDAIHADICAEAGLTAPDVFTSLEEAIEKLTSQG